MPPTRMLREPDNAPPPEAAGPVLRLFDALNRENIQWCSWKSNEHLEAGLTGKTDLDLLLDPSRREDVMRVLKECGYIQFRTPLHRSYPDIFDAFSMDPETGALLHAHCHFALVIGEKHLKSYTLPWAETILLHRHEQLQVKGIPIYAAAPMDEMIILLVREALKFRWRDMARFHMGRLWSDAGMKLEFDWLKNRVDYDEFRARAIGLTSSPCSSQMTNILYKELTLQGLLRLREIVQLLAAEKKWRRMNAPVAMGLAKWREGVFYLTQLQRRYNLNWPALPQSATLPGDGILVYLKSDKLAEKWEKAMHETWQCKLDIRWIHLSGEQSSLKRKLREYGISKLKRRGIIIIGSGQVYPTADPDLLLDPGEDFESRNAFLKLQKSIWNKADQENF